MQIIFTGCFLDELLPTRATFPRNFQCRKAPGWLSKFYHFVSKIWRKKHPEGYAYRANYTPHYIQKLLCSPAPHIFWWKQVSWGLCVHLELIPSPVGQKIICQTKIVLSQLINFASLFYLSAIFENSETGHRSPMKNASHLRASTSIQEEQNYRRVHHHMLTSPRNALNSARKP